MNLKKIILLYLRSEGVIVNRVDSGGKN